jgi:hypothetical protein
MVHGAFVFRHRGRDWQVVIQTTNIQCYGADPAATRPQGVVTVMIRRSPVDFVVGYAFQNIKEHDLYDFAHGSKIALRRALDNAMLRWGYSSMVISLKNPEKFHVQRPRIDTAIFELDVWIAYYTQVEDDQDKAEKVVDLIQKRQQKLDARAEHELIGKTIRAIESDIDRMERAVSTGARNRLNRKIVSFCNRHEKLIDPVVAQRFQIIADALLVTEKKVVHHETEGNTGAGTAPVSGGEGS